MAKRLYVGNLPYSVRDEQLKELFSPFGAVSQAQVVMEKFSTRSKGFGFVEFEDDNAATEAIAKLNGTEVDGRSIVVNEARPMGERREGGGGGGGFRRGGGGRGGGYGGGGGGGRDRDRGGYGGGGGGRDRDRNRW